MGIPTLLLWGRPLFHIYNDPYRLLIQQQQLPLGLSFHECWPALIPVTAPIFERVWRGESVIQNETRFPDLRPGGRDSAWMSTSYSPLHDETGSVAGVWITQIETTERVRAEEALRENEAQLTQLLELVPVGINLFDAAGGILKTNPEMRRLFDIDPQRAGAVQRSVFDPQGHRLTPREYPTARALRGEVVRPEADILLEVEGARRWLKVGAVPFVRDGKITGGVVVAHDVTEAKESAGRMRVLVAELQHRTRNLIAMVRALADKTLRGSASLDDFTVKFRARLAALARVQGLLSHHIEGSKVTFEALLRAELAAHAGLDEGARVTLAGPAGVRLRSGTVQTLALALHELATNAVKYGALAQRDAHLNVSWRVEPADERDRRWLHVEWRESGVAMPTDAAPPSGGGYGRELIEQVLPYQHRARTTFALEPDGARCTIALPIAGEAAE